MVTDRRIEEAIRAGEKNRQTMELVHNWCAYARIEKMGGVGLIEQQTGLPIGHHAVTCDHAAAGGMGCWDLADAALDFYDRNCVDCSKRSPVGLPNISRLLSDREAAKRKKQEDEEISRKRTEEELLKREKIREQIRATLPALSATVIDQIKKLDMERSKQAEKELLQTVQLAPEIFTPPIIDLFFSTLENREVWFYNVGLQALRSLKANPARLTRCALICLQTYSANRTAAEIVQQNINLVDKDLVAGALRCLVDLAMPLRSVLDGSRHPTFSGPLQDLHDRYTAAVESALAIFLDERRPELASVGARGILVLAHRNRAVAARFTRPLAAKLARSQWLLEEDRTGFGNGQEVIPTIRDALYEAFQEAPEQTDALLASFLAGAPADGQAQIFSVYSVVLREHFREEENKSTQESIRIGLKRVIWALTTFIHNLDVILEFRSILSNTSSIGCAARQELDSILGAALILDDALEQMCTPLPKGASFLQAMEHSNRRMTLSSLRNQIIKWSACIAAGAEESVAKYVELYSGVPNTHVLLRGAMVEHFHLFMHSPSGLRAVLPVLYSALIGAEPVLRASAASTIGEIRTRIREDLPDLLFEAFSALLSDPYVVVHKAAVLALFRFKLPDRYNRIAKPSLLNIINAYSSQLTTERQDENFLVECIELYSRRYLNNGTDDKAIADYFVRSLLSVTPETLGRHVAYLSRSLSQAEKFPDILLRTLESPEAMEFHDEDILLALKDIPPVTMYAVREKFLASTRIAAKDKRYLLGDFLEILTQASAWDEAAELVNAIYESIEDTVRNRPLRLSTNTFRIAAYFEKAIARGEVSVAAANLAQEWDETHRTIEEDRVENEARRSPLRGLFGPN